MPYRLHALSIALPLALALVAGQAQAARVDNFMLLDHEGAAHELYYYRDAPAVVIMAQGNGCPIVRNALNDYKALRDRYREQGVEFYLLNANLQDDRASIRKEAAEWDIDIPILDDEAQLIGESLGLVRTAEVLVIDPKTWQVAYRGPLNDRINDYERQRAEASEHYAADAIEALIGGEGQAIQVAERDAIGCLINFPARDQQPAQINYVADVAPILQQNCVVCHQEGGIGPWAMTGYNMVRGFAPMIREVVRTKRMPPWHADPHIGAFKNGRGLTIEEAQTLVHWAEAGAPRGEGEDPLALADNKAAEWPLGEPDLIIDIPAYEVPANGVVDYQFPVVKNPLDEPRWIVATDILPGDRNVVHHVLFGSTRSETAPSDRGLDFEQYIDGYAPGNEGSHMPEGTGILVDGGGYYQFQMHYTPYGKAVVDESKLGLYFADEPPANYLRQSVVVDPTIRVPANDPRYQEEAYLTFDRDALLHSVVPALPLSGHRLPFRVAAAGRQQQNPAVGAQLRLQLAAHLRVRRTGGHARRQQAGTSHDVRQFGPQPRQPGPQPRDVPWGLQSWDEMLYGAVQFTWVEESVDNPIHNEELHETFQFVGFMDRNMDGKLVWSELPERMKKQLVQGFAAVDTNGDGGLDANEIFNMENRRDDVAATDAGPSAE